MSARDLRRIAAAVVVVILSCVGLVTVSPVAGWVAAPFLVGFTAWDTARRIADDRTARPRTPERKRP